MAAKKSTTKKSATKKPVKTPKVKKAPVKGASNKAASPKASVAANKAAKANGSTGMSTDKPSESIEEAADQKESLEMDPATFSKSKTNNHHSSAFIKKQRQRLLDLRDELVDSMSGMTRDTIRNAPEGSEASGSGQHQGDAGSDAYDRDFALSLLSQERDSLFEIDAALKKFQEGTYGLCEISGKQIPHARLEALPFARYTVECQAELEKTNRLHRVRQPVTSLFGLNEDEAEGEEEESSTESKE